VYTGGAVVAVQWCILAVQWCIHYGQFKVFASDISLAFASHVANMPCFGLHLVNVLQPCCTHPTSLESMILIASFSLQKSREVSRPDRGGRPHAACQPGSLRWRNGRLHESHTRPAFRLTFYFPRFDSGLLLWALSEQAFTIEMATWWQW
jgi:hypothetical protein